jgi:two-component system, NarL family, sensor kinase
MKVALTEMGDYRSALEYDRIYDSLYDIYRAKEHLDKLNEIELQDERQKKEQKIFFQTQTIKTNNQLILLLVISIILFLVLVVLYVIVQNRKKKIREHENTLRYTKQLLEKTEEERKRIAGDLHDSINHELIELRAEPGMNAEAKKKIDSIINEVRNISRNLHPVLFDKIRLTDSIDQLAKRTQQQHNFIITTQLSYSKTLPVNTELQIYRIVQEALNNMIKHADAVAGIITIEETPHEVIIEIKDNGKGFDVQEKINNSSAFGINNIMERGRVIGANVSIASAKNGTRINIKLPKNNK